MAWNDVKFDDNAVHLMILIGGHSYKFNSTSIKVERKIGDTLNKFSLTVVDDGTDDYIEFERIVTSRFVNLEVAYGNSSGTMTRWQGFVADYQPAFLGSSSQLTVTGYLSRKQSGLPDQSSPYLYYMDWAPVVGKRKDETKDWDDIYNGHFSFTADSFGNKLEPEFSMTNEEAWKIIDNIAKNQSSSINSNMESVKSRVYSAIKNAGKSNEEWNQLLGYYGGNVGEVINKMTGIYFYRDENGEWDTNSFYILTGGDTEPIPQYTETIEGANPFHQVMIGGTEWSGWASILGTDLANQLTSFNNKLNQVEDMKFKLADIRIKDKDGMDEVSSATYGVGHVPWDFNIIKCYTGNIQFSKYSHPKDSRRSIARVIPDLFVKWDKDAPMAPEYLDKDGKPRSGDPELFPDDAINDIKVFGLQYAFNSQVYAQDPGNPYKAITLFEDDIHGKRRVYSTPNGYYVWVGDCPELYKEWEKNGWKYSEKSIYKNTVSSNLVGATVAEMIQAMTAKAITEYSGKDGVFKPRKAKPDKWIKYYNTRSNGGVSTCIQGKPVQEGLNVLCNCVGYAAGRFHEIMGSDGFTYSGLNCNAEDFIERAKSAGLQVSSSPTLGGIMVWKLGSAGNGNDGAGHVAVVEEIIDSNNILISESGYNSFAFQTRKISSSTGWDTQRGYVYRGCIVNPILGRVADASDVIENAPTKVGITADKSPKKAIYEKGTEYEVGTYLAHNKTDWGVVEKAFKASGDFADDVIKGNIKRLTYREYSVYSIYGEGRKTYKISGIKEDVKKGIKGKLAEDRIKDYLRATYRSASPLNYGVVYISDIVAQLCILEGWKNPIIRTTKAVSYNSDFLSMGGMGALEYITQKLCPNAIEDSDSGRSGFAAFFDSKGIFHFEPINANLSGTVLTVGYNVKDSNVLSFTVRSRGQILMLGINETYEGVNSLTGSTVSVTQTKNSMKMSETEELLSKGNAAQFFNLSLYNYYGYDKNSNADYLSFTNKLYEAGGINETIPYGTSLIRRAYESSISGSKAAVVKAWNDLTQLQNTSIQAELTMIGDNTIEPGKYIQVINYSRRGYHYTSGKYYVKSMTDNVSISQGYTQSLELCRWNSEVPAMNESPKEAKLVANGVQTKFDEAMDIIQSSGIDAFNKWYEANFPVEEAKTAPKEPEKNYCEYTGPSKETPTYNAPGKLPELSYENKGKLPTFDPYGFNK